MNELEQLENAISALEAQRHVLGDVVVDAALGPMREKLAVLRGETKLVREERQRKQITVLFADVSGFTRMAEQLDHEEVSEVINALWSRMDRAITDHGGLIDKHIGDSVMALFGAPTAQEDDPDRAIRTALTMQSEVKEWKSTFDHHDSNLQSLVQEIQIRIGINTGPVLLGTVGSTGEYTAMGDAVNLASRLEHAAPLGGVLISQNTYQHVRGIFDVTPLDPIEVKGKSELVKVYIVNARRPRSFRITTRGVDGIETPTIGREAELAKMKSAVQGVMDKTGLHLVSIVADAGTGKSRLLYEFMRWLDEQHFKLHIFKGRATPEMQKSPYALIRNLLSTSFEIQDSDTATEAQEKLERGVRAYAGDSQDVTAQVPFIGHLIGFDYSDNPYLRGVQSDARQIRDLAFHYAAKFLEASTRERNGVIFLEDIHWADNGSLDLVEYILNQKPELPVLIIALTRPGFFDRRSEWGKGPMQYTQLDLQPLSDTDCRRLVVEILRKVPQVPPALVELIVNRAEGSPFYVEELIKALIDEGIIVKNEDYWQVKSDRLPDLKVPATLTGVLQARLDNLPVNDREVLQQASVVGRVFWNRVLEFMQNPENRPEKTSEVVSGGLNALENKELIFHRDASAFADTTEYIFKHSILHDVTYESVLLKLRRIYHIQAAKGLIELGGQRVSEFSGRVGEHFELAEEWASSAEWYARAGIQAQETYALEAAKNYYRKALEFLEDLSGPDVTTRKLDISNRLGEVLNWQARYSEAAEVYRLMLSSAQDSGNIEAQARAHYGLANSLGFQGEHRAALESAVESEKLARKANSTSEIARALYMEGSAYFRLGESGIALELGEQALAISVQSDERDETGRYLNLIGAAHYVLGRYSQAEEYFERALAIFTEQGNRRQGMDLLSNLGVISEAYGDYETALQRYQNALEIAREIGYRDGEIVFLSNRGGQRVALEDYQAAEADLREAIRLAGAAGSWVLALTYGSLAVARLGQDNIEGALESALKALDLGRMEDSPESIGIAWKALGMTAAATGESIRVRDAETDLVKHYSAAECYEESLKELAEAGLDGERARTLREWARSELKCGNTDKGTALWVQAREIFTSLGAQKEVERMRKIEI